MSNRTAKFVSAIFGGLLASAPLATIPHRAAGAADNCLSGPKGEAAAGSHWYYRVDRTTKRHCWYLREESEKPSQTASTTSSPANPVAAKSEAKILRSIADARAELPAQTPFEPARRADQAASAISTDATSRENIATTRMPEGGAPTSVVASRWPNPWDATPSAEPAPIKRDAVADVSAPSRPQPTSAPVTVAAADAPSPTPAYSVQMHLVALMAALALAGMLGSIIFKLAFQRRPAQPILRARPDTGAIWEPTDDDRIVLPAQPATDARARRPGFARGLDRNANDRIAEFFAQLSKRAPG